MVEVNRRGSQISLEMIQSLRRILAMPQALSRRERECVVGFVEEGHSRREAARVFKTAPSTTVRIVRRFRQTGSLEARPRGGFRHGKLPAHRAFIMETVGKQPDITMPELAAVLLAEKAISVAPATLSRFLIACGFSFKKNPSGKRTRQA
jgi:transposase